MSRYTYKKIGLGGTFDHFHKGHEHFLEFAAKLADKLAIGVTHQTLTLSKPFAPNIQTFKTRSKSVDNFCQEKNINHSITKLLDIYGPTLSDKSIQALCVTPETLEGAKKINDSRTALGMRELPIHICDMVLDSSGVELHSARIRAGKVSRQGLVYLEEFGKKGLTLTDDQKNEFKKPLGKIISLDKARVSEQDLVCLVGDVTLSQWLERQKPFSLGVFDLQSERKDYPSPKLTKIKTTFVAKNPAGSITKSLVSTLQDALDTNQKYVRVEGEEDLAVIALVLALPLMAKVYYGQPGHGLVEVVVTESLKDKVAKILGIVRPGNGE